MVLRLCIILLPASLAAAQSGVRLDVPFITQSEEGCGAAAIAMVSQYWGRSADPDRILRELYSPELHGIRARDMARHFRANGFRAFEFRASWGDLASHLAKGRPLIIALREGSNALHYVVVAGIDPQDGVVSVNDPARRKLMRLERADFERRWQNRWTLLALPETQR